MKSLLLRCPGCSAPLEYAESSIRSAVFCPYCGSVVRLPEENEAVRLARINSEIARILAAADYQAYLDGKASERSLFRARIVVICVFAAAVLALSAWYFCR